MSIYKSEKGKEAILSLDFLMKDFHIYAVDTIGHSGKRAEVSLCSNDPTLVMAAEKKMIVDFLV